MYSLAGLPIFNSITSLLILLMHVATLSAARADGTDRVMRMNSGTDTGRRDLRIQEGTSSTSGPETTTIPAHSSISTDSVTQTTATPTPSAPLQLPRPFDLNLGNNFTQQSCPNFFNSYIVNNASLQSCVPFSLLLQNSNGFIKATKFASTLTPIIDASCHAAFDSCNSLMSNLAQKLVSSDACGNDMALENPLVIRAYNGLVSYGPMFRASCLKADPRGKSDQGTYDYCYVTAMNSTSPADSEMYYLPLGLELAAGSSVSCSRCTQQNMAIFASAAADTNSPLNKDYLNAANMVNNACGADFVNASSSVTTPASGPSENGGSGMKRPGIGLIFPPVVAAAAFILS